MMSLGHNELILWTRYDNGLVPNNSKPLTDRMLTYIKLQPTYIGQCIFIGNIVDYKLIIKNWNYF